MSKNIIMQQKTASGYEELYPKADGDGSVIVNNTTNQFLGGGSTVGDALEYLSKFGMYWWKKVESIPVWEINKTRQTDHISWDAIYKNVPSPDITQNGNYDTFGPIDVWMSKEAEINLNGEITLVNPTQMQLAGMYSGGEYQTPSVIGRVEEPCYLKIKGKFYYNEIKQSSYVFPSVGNRTTVKTENGQYYYGGYFSYNANSLSKCYILSPLLKGYETNITFIYSSNPNEYPDFGETDSSGAKYWKIGQPWDFLPKMGKIETGYYVGNGNNSAMPVLVFKNAPQLICIIATGSGQGYMLQWIKGSNKAFHASSGYSPVMNIDATQTGNSFTWYNGYMNFKDEGYYYFAITQ